MCSSSISILIPCRLLVDRKKFEFLSLQDHVSVTKEWTSILQSSVDESSEIGQLVKAHREKIINKRGLAGSKGPRVRAALADMFAGAIFSAKPSPDDVRQLESRLRCIKYLGSRLITMCNSLTPGVLLFLLKSG